MRLHFIASLFLALPLLIGNRGASAQTGLFPAGSRHLYVHCEGQRHGPAVILDAGLFRDSTDWRLVQPEVARFTQVCSYDREVWVRAWSIRGQSLRRSASMRW